MPILLDANGNFKGGKRDQHASDDAPTAAGISTAPPKEVPSSGSSLLSEIDGAPASDKETGCSIGQLVGASQARTAMRSVGTVTRTRLVWLLMRIVPYQRLHQWRARGWFRPLSRALLRGDLWVLGGIGVHMRLRARSFAPWGAQAYAVLTGTHEVQVQEAMRRNVGAGDVVWDVGANIGALSLVAARIVGPSGRVIAIEPEAECAAAIRSNAELNGLDWLEVREIAATAETTEVEVIVVDDSLWTRLASVGEHDLAIHRRLVPGYALDDLVAPPPTLVKIDVEGAELDVLSGMRRLLADVRPIVICEMHDRNDQFCEAMVAAGYYVINLDGPEAIVDAGPNVHAICVPQGRHAG
jgi:FkbM family methyltransferase